MSEIIERVERPSYQDFQRRFLDRDRPVVITGALDDWPAYQRWSFEHLASILGEERVSPIVLDDDDRYRDGKGFAFEEMTFHQYLQHLAENERPTRYLRLPLEGDVLADYRVPEYCRRRIALKKNLWVGAGGISTVLHYDMTHNMIAQLLGRRKIALFAPDQGQYLYPQPLRTLTWNHSRVRLDAVDPARFPLVARARRVEIEIGRGDLLFIPRGWWHRVTTLEPAIAINFFWITPRQVPSLAIARIAWTLHGLRT